jgi:hypothetical protein
MDDKILSNILKGFCNQIFILTEKQKNGYIKTFKKQSFFNFICTNSDFG